MSVSLCCDSLMHLRVTGVIGLSRVGGSKVGDCLGIRVLEVQQKSNHPNGSRSMIIWIIIGKDS